MHFYVEMVGTQVTGCEEVPESEELRKEQRDWGQVDGCEPLFLFRLPCMIYNNITSTIKILKYWKLTEALVPGSPQHRGEEKFSVPGHGHGTLGHPGHGHGTLGHLPLETVISSLVVVITSSQTFWQSLNLTPIDCTVLSIVQRKNRSWPG